MSSTVTIPRFLLPQRGQIWRRVQARPAGASSGGMTVAPPIPARVRFASSKPPAAKASPAPAPKKPLVLEKPARFNPPSHGARLPNKQHTPKHYGGSLSPEALKAQSVKEYPGMMAPRGTWTHWFLHSKSIHLFITLGTLSGLAMYTFVQNFKMTSPYVDMIPPWSDFFSHPFSSLHTLKEVMRLTTEHKSAIAAEKRDKRLDDAVKRQRFRKAHGIEAAGEGTMVGWLKGNSSVIDPEEEREKAAATAAAAAADANADDTPPAEEGKRKKFLGIF
ncbi:hypothetical protein MAPG_00762 [Magnaporthiopsis poae ATCC 64411]|uniref:Uncharacterized protein n=1 Tax=Magnaporthiopsis poae (strain ATCC 64411 / 73-15) TaxID=644358 RepID=A0A0C4DLW4_MAGP6|nr:hypothetical protein MAPG_00762 [Magnaporthiopsis poae ATCC 64411]